MNTRKVTTRREDKVLANEGIPTYVDQENVSEAVPPPEPQGPQGPQMSPMPQDQFFEGFMTNAEFMDALMSLTLIIRAQFQVITNHLVDQGNQKDRPQQNVCTLTSRILDFMTVNLPTSMELRWIKIHKAL